MWNAKLKIRHDCIFDDRCEKYQVEASVVSFNPFKKNKFYYTYHFGTIVGDKSQEFLKDIKKDKRVNNIEIEGNTFFIVEKRTKRESPGMLFNPELIYIKPPLVDKTGWETWELAALKRETLVNFCKKVSNCRMVSIQKTKLSDIYFPKLSPALTDNQKKALLLAMKRGFYDFPRKVHLEGLAKMSRLSRATFREHLRKAEKKVLGDIF